MPIRITGLNSGLDTEAIISALVSSYNYKTNKYKKAQTKLSWKQDAWKTLNTKIYSLYSSVGSLKLSSAYNLKSTTVSDTTKATVTASNSAPSGTQSLNIISVAQAGYLTGGQLDSSTTTSTTLAELGYTGGDAKINVTKGDGTTTSVTVTQGTTVANFVAELKDAGVSASYDETNHRIFVSSKNTGKDNDFTLTGGNTDGVSALYKLGLNVGSKATDATYATYEKYYDADGNQLQQNVVDAIKKYQEAQKTYETDTAKNANLSASYGYASAYSAMMEALAKVPSADDAKKLQKLLGMTATQRVDSLMDADGNVYTEADKDSLGNTIYSYKDENGQVSYIRKMVTYSDTDGTIYTKNDDGTYTDGDGHVWSATGEKDDDGNTKYSYTAEDGTVKTAVIKENTDYYNVTATETGTGRMKYTDTNGVTYTPNDDNTFAGSDGNTYKLSDDGTTFTQVDSNGNAVSGGKTATVDTSKTEEIKKTEYHQVAQNSDIKRATDVLSDIKGAEANKDILTDDFISELTSNIEKVNTFEQAEDTLDSTDASSRASIMSAVKDAYASNGTTGVTELTNTYAAQITANKAEMDTAQATMNDNKVLSKLASIDTSTTEGVEEYNKALTEFVSEVQNVHEITKAGSAQYNTDAKKIDGTDSEITLNGITYTSSLNTYSINGLSITALQATGAGDTNAISITTSTDTQGIYDKIKDFLTQYNSLINEITSLYNADSAKGYDPLTDEEKDAMSDTEVEKWEQKIKDSLLRRDDSLEAVMNAMTSSMSKGVEVNGKTYYLSNFGIKTLGYLNAPENQQNAYHIDGDSDDTATSGNTDKLMSMITSDPDTVVAFMQQLTGNLYDAIGDKMKSSSVSSIYKVYNDKEMASEYSDYTDLIKKWEQKLQDQEDYYYNKFSAMETALSKLNSQTSSLSNLFGG